ncbi:MAG: hypothetical protein QOE88_1739 [Verrucomicrobiota bacterium]|nr:hypothetical protein [Verrucomicrobiota bacterium]
MIPLKNCRLAALVAVLALSSLLFAPKILADDIGNAVDAFDRDLGLERLGPDIVNVDQQNPNTEKSSSTVNGKPNGNRRKTASVHRPLSSDLLSFQASQRVTDTLRGYMIAKVTQNDPNGLAATEKRFANDAILHRFDRKFSPYGYSSHNLGDTLAGYLIASWEMINNTDASQSPEGIRRVREAVRRRMMEIGKVTALPDVDKQRYSEVFKYVTILVIDHLNELKAKHNEAGQRQLLDQVAKPPLKIGLDLRKMRLTDQGFVKKVE